MAVKYADEELFLKWIFHKIEWTHPTTGVIAYGSVSGVEDGYLIVRSMDGETGIRESWITHTITEESNA